jgi:hypothetical protein
MKLKKQFWFALVVCFLGFSQAQAQTSGTHGDFRWSLDNEGMLTVSGTGIIPDGQGPWATDMVVMAKTKAIVIEEGVTHIGRMAFKQMAHALSLTIPASVISIGEEAFRGLNRLERIYSLNPVAPTMHENSFMNAGMYAANELKLYVPADARSHYAEALVWKSMDMYQWGLSADGTPLVVTDHISWSLDGDVLTVSGKGVIPDDYSPWRADMSVVAKVRTIVIEEGITHIGDRTFMLMQATSLMLPASVISIGDEAFRDNRMIERIYSLNPVAPILHVHSLLNVGISVDALPMLYVLADAMSSYAEAEVWNSMTMSELSADGIPDGFDGSWSLDGSVLTVRGKGVIPDGYRPWALDLNVMNKVKTIRIEEGITRIGMRSFMNMMHVTSLTLPASVSHIDEDAFSGLVALKEFNSLRPVAPVAYEKSFTDAGRDADLKFYIPQGSMKNYAAASVWERFSLNEKFAHPGWEFSGSELTIMAHLWKPAEVWSMVDRAEVRSVVIKEDVFNAEIEASAFEGLVNLTSISIPANITKIGARAFAGTGLKEVSLVHLSVLNVANNSFDGLESAVLYVPESVLGAYKESAWKDAFEFIGVAGSSLRLGTEKVILLKGKTQMLTPTVVPELWMDRVVWTSSDSKVASVSNGIIEAKSSGEAVITATVYGIALPAVVSVSVVTNPSDATLKSLIVSGESLTVDNATFSYSHAVASSVTSVKIEPVANHATAKLSVEGAEELAFGDNEYTIKVVSEDNSQTAEYRLVVRRLSNDAALKSLVVLDGSMEISLDPAKTSHTIKVNHSEPVIRIKAESDAQATIKMLDQEASVGSASATIAIRHNDVVTIKVTAGDGTEKEYALVIDRARENDVTLSGIFVNGLPVEYDAEKDRYVGHVVWSASTVQLTAKASNKEEATVEGEGKLMLRKGENGPFVLTVTAADKTTKKSYEVYITRNEEASSDASLKSLDVNEGTLEPAFDMETTEYFVNVGKSLSISFTAVANHLGATVKADEKYLLTVGEQTIAILVEAEDGTEREYKLNVTRDRNEFSENPLLLNDLDVSVGTLYPSFSPEQFSYKVHVSSNTEKINIAVSQHPDASVSGEGLKKLGYGENEFVITVLSGMEEEIYNITVVRANPEGTAGKEITWMLSDGVLTFTGAGDFNDDFSYTEFSEEVREAVKEVVIEEGITSISKQAFMKFSNLTTVTLPESLKRIHEEAFSLSGLTSVILPEGLELLEGFAFAGCPKLVSVTNRSKTPLEIDRTVFTGENLEPSSATLRVPAGFETAYAEAEGWKDLKIEYIDIDWSVEGTMLYIHGNGESARMLNYSDEEDGKRAPWYKKGSQITTIIVEGNVENIGDYAFYGFTNLTAILLPNSLTEIGEYAFRGNNLKFLTLPSLSLTTIGKGAFYGNENLQSITIAEGVTTIAEEAFYGAKSLEAISIPESVTTIGARAFWGADQLSKVVFPTGLTYVGDEAFYGAIRLKNVSIAQNPNIVFGARVFYGSENLETIVNFNTNPSPVDPTLFDGVEISDLTLYVPAESLEAYMAAEVWKEFNVQPIDASFGTGISKVASSEVRIYSYAQKLYVNSPVSEQVNVYSITGSLLGSVKKSAGETSLSVRSGQILIVKGSSGWVKKVKI